MSLRLDTTRTLSSPCSFEHLIQRSVELPMDPTGRAKVAVSAVTIVPDPHKLICCAYGNQVLVRNACSVTARRCAVAAAVAVRGRSTVSLLRCSSCCNRSRKMRLRCCPGSVMRNRPEHCCLVRASPYFPQCTTLRFRQSWTTSRPGLIQNLSSPAIRPAMRSRVRPTIVYLLICTSAGV